KTVAVVDDIEDAAAKDVALLLGLGLEQAENQVLLAQRGDAVHPQLAGQVLQLVTGLSFEFGKIHRALRLASTGPRSRRRCAERHPDEAVATMGLGLVSLTQWPWKAFTAGRHGFRALHSGGTKKRPEALRKAVGQRERLTRYGNPRGHYSTIRCQQQP